MTATDWPITATELATAASIFRRVLVGVDGTEPGFEACRQAARLAEADAAMDAVAVVHLAEAVAAAMDAPGVVDQLKRESAAALDRATDILGEHAQKRFVNGFVTAALLSEIDRADATLLALGSHGHRRLTEILIGGVAGELLHRAPCSVLIVRATDDPETFPRSLVVGVDGSNDADTALAAAQYLAARFGSPLRSLTALEDKDVDLAHVHARSPLSETVDEHPVEALVAASREADLVVVGSRGLHGLQALGSVSERVAHQAACSVLVVRTRATPDRLAFEPAEWQLLCQAPTYAGLIVATAEHGGFFWEALSIARTFAEVRARHGENRLLDEIVAERPLVERTSLHSVDELCAHGLARIRAAIKLLEQKARPTDVDAFARFVLDIAEHVADAYPQRGRKVSDAENAALADVRAAVGLAPDAMTAPRPDSI